MHLAVNTTAAAMAAAAMAAAAVVAVMVVAAMAAVVTAVVAAVADAVSTKPRPSGGLPRVASGLILCLQLSTCHAPAFCKCILSGLWIAC